MKQVLAGGLAGESGKVSHVDPWADDRVRCEDCANYGPVSKWHPSRERDGAHKRVTLDGCQIDRAHTVGDRLRRCQDFERAER